MAKIIKKGGFILAVLFTIGFTAHLAFADDLADKTKQLNDINKQITQQQNQVNSLKKKATTLQSQIATINGQITLAQLQLEAIGTQIDQTNDQISKTNGELVSSEMQIFDKKKDLELAVRQEYVQQQMGIIQVIIGSNNLSDFLEQLEYISAVESRVTSGISDLQKLDKDLAVKKGDLESSDKQLKSLQSAQQLQQNSLNSQVQGKATLLTETNNSEAEYQKQLQKSISEQASIQNDIAKLAANAPKIDLHPGVLQWPIGSRTITASFHDPDYYRLFHLQHDAIDIATPQGTPIHAPASGYVLKVHDGGMGYSYIQINHGDGLVTVYGHPSQILVTQGQFVAQGSVIGLSGATPGTPGAGLMTTGPHLHFEVWQNGVARNPLSYLGS